MRVPAVRRSRNRTLRNRPFALDLRNKPPDSDLDCDIDGDSDRAQWQILAHAAGISKFLASIGPAR